MDCLDGETEVKLLGLSERFLYVLADKNRSVCCLASRLRTALEAKNVEIKQRVVIFGSINSRDKTSTTLYVEGNKAEFSLDEIVKEYDKRDAFYKNEKFADISSDDQKNEAENHKKTLLAVQHIRFIDMKRKFCHAYITSMTDSAILLTSYQDEYHIGNLLKSLLSKHENVATVMALCIDNEKTTKVCYTYRSQENAPCMSKVAAINNMRDLLSDIDYYGTSADRKHLKPSYDGTLLYITKATPKNDD